MLHVVVSSTLNDLPKHREKVRDACLRRGAFPLMMEYAEAGSGTAETRSLALVDEADVYLGILGFRYGEVSRKSGRSYTQMELQRALQRGIPTFVFHMSEEYAFASRSTPVADPLATELRRWTKETFGADYFTSPESLMTLVVEALIKVDPRAVRYDNTYRLPKPPAKPVPFVPHPYTLLDSASVIGRQADITALNDWCVSPPDDQRVLVVSALGGVGKTATTWKWFNDVLPNHVPLSGRLRET